MPEIKLKRAYDAPSPHDGVRVLVDRIWPRGVSKENASIDVWLKDVAPSTGLRKWFNHDPARWAEFKTRYRTELRDNPAMDELRDLARKGSITLVFGARDEEHNQAIVLQEVLREANGP